MGIYRSAIIGGTGIDEMPGFSRGREEIVSTRYGKTLVVFSKLAGADIAFVPRHGLGHTASPSNINYRAIIASLKILGVSTVLATCAVGSLKNEIFPGSFAVLGDFIDCTRNRVTSFFDDPDSPVVHTDFSVPYCPDVSGAILESCRELGEPVFADSIYVGVDGPRYESPAEIRVFTSWGGDVVGMTNVPEVLLAREAGICYGALAIVTNYAAGISKTGLNHDEVRQAVLDRSNSLSDVLARSVELLANRQECGCARNDKLDIG